MFGGDWVSVDEVVQLAVLLDHTQLQVLITGYFKGYDILPPIVTGEWFKCLALLVTAFYSMCFRGGF